MTEFKVTFYFQEDNKTVKKFIGEDLKSVSDAVKHLLRENDFIDNDLSKHNCYLSFRSSAVLRYLVEIN